MTCPIWTRSPLTVNRWGEHRVDGHILRRGLRAKQSNHLADDLVQIDIPRLDAGLGQKTPQALDDVVAR